jgi:hypothetical protein
MSTLKRLFTGLSLEQLKYEYQMRKDRLNLLRSEVAAQEAELHALTGLIRAGEKHEREFE